MLKTSVIVMSKFLSFTTEIPIIYSALLTKKMHNKSLSMIKELMNLKLNNLSTKI